MTDTTAAFRFGYGLPLPEGAPTTPQEMMAVLQGPDLAAEAHPGGGGIEVVRPLLVLAAGRPRHVKEKS